MAFNFNWFIKITRSFGSGFQSQNIAKPKVRLIMIKNRSEQTFLPDQIKGHFGFELATHSLPIVFFFYVSIMFITIMSVALLAWPSRDEEILLIFLFLFLRRGTYYCCMLPFWVMLTLGFFPFQHLSAEIFRLENSIVPLRLVLRHRCAELRFVLLSGALKGSQVSPNFVLTRMIASGSSRLCAFNCKINS
jgi:hypothetical protein